MNQKYLQGLSTNMDGSEDAVFLRQRRKTLLLFDPTPDGSNGGHWNDR